MAIERPDAQGLERALKEAVLAAWAPNPALQQECVRYLLACIGEDPSRPGLLDTPKRVVKALDEMTCGRNLDPVAMLGTVFEEPCDEMVLVRGIRFVSLCEHHLLPFVGEMSVGYVPNGRVVGLSKIPRMVEAWSRRPSMQERLTQQVAHTLHDCLGAQGTAVVARAHHACMGCRGVRQPDADMVTSCLLGSMKERDARSEFMALAGIRKV
jgi:GTP cyclohydrolase I